MMDELDHRSLGQRLDLFHFQEEAPGMVFWHPRGFVLYRLLRERVRLHLQREGYSEVQTPQLLAQSIWESSGHWQNFRGDMFIVEEEERSAAIKPVSCPGHIQIFQRRAPSFRDLPIRLSEFGLVHRKEPSGSLHGLFRLRQFTQDDGHIFCEEEQAADEVALFAQSLRRFYSAFGFEDVSVSFSSRPPVHGGGEEVWDRAENGLMDAAKRAGLDFKIQPGQGAFYGPKLEFALKDRLEREWQCGTIQLDFVMPARFEMSYVDSGGARRPPALLHRALFGSIERFLGVLLEHHRGALPAWLAPDQIVVALVSDSVGEYARLVAEKLSRAELRAQLDDRPETLARKIVRAHERGVPYIVIIGNQERARNSISFRDRQGQQESLGLEDGVRALRKACSAESS